MREPRIELGPPDWQSGVIPLNYSRLNFLVFVGIKSFIELFKADVASLLDASIVAFVDVAYCL